MDNGRTSRADTLTPVEDQKKCIECSRIFSGLALCPHDGALLINLQKDQLLGTIFANSYEILSVIGHGGMGVVYKARHTGMDRIVAIKMLRAQLVSDRTVLRRFQQEVRASSRINHPHVITVHDYGVSEGLPYIVMDYLQGLTLSQLLDQEDHLDVDRAIKILSQACEGLAFAHKQGVIHRDLKPGNIVLINYNGVPDFVKVVDFGVARIMDPSLESQRLTQDGDVLGSPLYMSPEQCMGQELGPPADIYAMGIVMYETLTGRLPIFGKTAVETIAKQVTQPPMPFSESRPDLYIPERLQQIIFKALDKDPANRYELMEHLRHELETVIPPPGQSTLRAVNIKTSTAAQPQQGASRKHLLLAGAVCSALVAGGAAVWAILGSPHATPPAVHPATDTQPSTAQPHASLLRPPPASLEPERSAIQPESTTKIAPDKLNSDQATKSNLQDQESMSAAHKVTKTAQEVGNSHSPLSLKANDLAQTSSTRAKDQTNSKSSPIAKSATRHAVPKPPSATVAKPKAAASKADPWGSLRSHKNQTHPTHE